MRGRRRHRESLSPRHKSTRHYQSLIMAWLVGVIGQWPLGLGLMLSLVGLDERFLHIESMQAKAFGLGLS